jgi:hypothetical protein
VVARVLLGGVEIGGDVTGAGYDWELRSGVDPVERQWRVSRARADQIPPMRPLELRIESERETLVVQHVYLLQVLPGALPGPEQDATLRLADRRFLWSREWVSTTMNLRRATGDTRLANAGQNAGENALVLPEIEYARFSLGPNPQAPTAPWTAEDALRWLIVEKLGAPVVVRDQLPEVEIENLLLEDPGHHAVERLLAYLPGVNLYVDRDGQVVVYDTLSGGETAPFAAMTDRPHGGAGGVRVVRSEDLAPSEFVVHFGIESECRFDAQEPSSGSNAPVDEDEPNLIPVLQVPDPELELGDRTVARATWAEQSDVFAAWGAFGLYNTAVSFDVLRRFALKFGWANFEQAWGNSPLLPPNSEPLNALRARTAVDAYRRLYRVGRYFWQRIESMREVRVAILDFVTGAYAPAEVFCDWTRRPTFRGMSYQNDPNVQQGWFQRGWAANLADVDPAPVAVRVVDEQSGVIRLEPTLDPYGHSQAMVLGYPQGGLIPLQTGLAEANRTGQEVYARWDRVVVEEGFQVAVVMTVVPGSPNDTGRLWQERVPASAIGLEGRGPPMHLRVFPGIATARFGWTDSGGEAIKNAILGRGPWPADQLVNGTIVRDVAQATARRAAEAYRPRPMGTAVADMRPGVEPAGSLDSVQHVLRGNGVTETVATFRVARAPQDVWRYLSTSTRRALMGVLNQAGAR